MENIIPSLSKMWLKVLNPELSLFPRMETVVGTLSPKEEKLMKVLDFAEIENFVCTVQITNPPKDREYWFFGLNLQVALLLNHNFI